MKNAIPITAATVAALTLAACSPTVGEPEVTTSYSPPSRGATPASQDSGPDQSTREQVFVDQLVPGSYPSEGEAIVAGYLLCGELDDGVTVQQLVMEIVVADAPLLDGFDNDGLPELVGSAVGAFCPEHLDQIPGVS